MRYTRPDVTLVKLARPLHLLFLTMTYTLGVAIADYLGIPLSAPVFILGWLGLAAAHTSLNLLMEVFRPFNEPLIPEQTYARRLVLRDRLLLVSVILLTFAGSLIYRLHLSHLLSPAVVVLILASLLVIVAHSVPPFSLSRRGFGELLLALHIGYLPPLLGFTLQAGYSHRLVPLLALPVTALTLAYFLVLDFPTFAEDLKYERHTLLTRLGWQRAISLHHALVGMTFLLIGANILHGLSPILLWPVLLALPLAVWQTLLLRGIGLGARPLWRPLTILAATLLALTIYLLALSFFLR